MNKWLKSAVGVGFTAMSATVAFAGEHAGHVHGNAAAAPEVVKWGLEGMKEMSNIHPLVVHLPVAFLPISTVFFFLGHVLKKDGMLSAAKWMLYCGTLGAAAAVWTGLQAANTVGHNDAVHAIMTVHQNLGWVTLGLAVILSVWTLVAKPDLQRKVAIPFLAGSVLLAAVLIQQADMGGRMVYGKAVGINPGTMTCPIPGSSGQEPQAHQHDSGHQH